MDGELTIFQTATAGSSETNAMKIVEFLGKPIRRVQLTHEALGKQNLAELLPEGGSFIVSAATLAEVCKGPEDGFKLLRPLLRRARKAFIYGFQRAPEHAGVLKELTSGRISGIEGFRTEDAQFRVDPSFQSICAQFSGMTLGNADAARDFVFAERNGHSGCSSLVRIGRRPCFVFTEKDGCQLFLSACSDIADLDVLVPRHTSRLRFFSSLVPLMMFVTSNWLREVWRNERPRACFIIDDPLLTERYGFLEYRKLLEVMERGRFCTSMAFIPWNFRRSQPEVAQLFASHPQQYSLCIHGCDHTGGEYGATDYKLLRSKSQKAVDRMSRHKTAWGVDFDDVMVFPQGIFSRTAVDAIKSCNYLAAVNSTAYPVDVENALALRDLLDVAVTRFSNFPIFLRRSPEDLAELAFDLFLGKPALLVEHHGYFKNGYEDIAEIVEKVNALDRRLEWTNLADICSRACVQRTTANGDVQTKFFTDRFSLRNDTKHFRKYTLFRRRSALQPTPAITTNGRPAETFEDASWLKMELSLGPRQHANIRIEHQPKESTAIVTRERLVYRAKVLVRRSLSEFRDNYVDKSEFLSKTARTLLNQAKLGILKDTARGNS